MIVTAGILNCTTNYVGYSPYLKPSQNTLWDKLLTNPINAWFMVLVIIHLFIVFSFYHQHPPNTWKMIEIVCFVYVSVFSFILLIEALCNIASTDST